MTLTKLFFFLDIALYLLCAFRQEILYMEESQRAEIQSE